MRVRGLLGACILLGTLAVGTAEAAPRATAPPPLVGIISAGWGTACAIVTFHSVRCWGVNEFGTLGNGTTTSLEANPLPGEVSSPGTEVQAVAGGLNHTCEIDGGNVRCWGWNAFGQLGTGDFNDRTTPAGSVVTSGPASRIAAGNGHTCAIVAGGVQCWGHNDQGQLGNGQPGCDPEDLWSCQSATPVTVSGLSGVTALAAGNYHTCALADGAVRCWGANYSGQLGNGGPIDPTGFENVPVPVSGLGGDVTGVATGSEHSCVVTEAGSIKCWGSEQLRPARRRNENRPVLPRDCLSNRRRQDRGGMGPHLPDFDQGRGRMLGPEQLGAARRWNYEGTTTTGGGLGSRDRQRRTRGDGGLRVHLRVPQR